MIANTGGVLSILIPLAETAALTFPALSVQVPEADWLVPSLPSVTSGVQLAMPERPSWPVKLTVTFVLFQAAVFGCGVAAACAVGGVLSRPISTVA